MNKIEFLETTTSFAKEYRKDAIASIERNSHMNDIKSDDFVSQKEVDAILVDFINFIGIKNGIDYALYTSDLKSK